jgi:uncharacterized protein YbjT (DUF2867 family)
MILVTGGTGNIGSEVVRLLVEAGAPVRVLTRDSGKASTHGGRAQIAQGDLGRPETLGAAFAGVEKLFFVSPGANAVPALAAHAIDAAQKAGVRHVVMNSSSTILTDPMISIGRWHLEGEEILKGSGMAWTVLRPGNFASNALRWAGTIRSQGAVFGVRGGAQSAPIDPRDIAAVGARALLDAGHEGQTYVLTGAELMSMEEQIGIIARVIGKPVRFVEVPEAGARAGMLKSGMPEVMVDALLEMYRAYRTSGSGAVRCGRRRSAM